VVLDSSNARGTPQASGVGSSLGGVQASGGVVPGQQAQLTALAGGMVLSVSVAVGDQVKAGQVLLGLAGSEKIAAAAAAANLELANAQQVITDLNEHADQARAQAQQALADADKALKDAQDNRYRKNLARVTQATLDRAEADLVIARDVLDKAQDHFKDFENKPVEDVMRAQAFSQVAAAQQKVEQLQWNLDYLLSRPDTMEVQQADAAIAVALANQVAAKRAWDKLKNGPDPDAMALAKARLANAQAQLAASQASLKDLEIKAPFNGTITRVNIHSGEWVVPGQPIITLVDVERLRVETTDLSERDVPQVKVGQVVTVTVKALNLSLKGRVSQVSPVADILGGDVVYKTTIDLDSRPPELRAGMSVDVQFGK
jgi:HlyD family secretion protein